MAMVTDLQIWGKGRPLSEAVAGSTADVSPEVRWSVERLGGGEGTIDCGGGDGDGDGSPNLG